MLQRVVSFFKEEITVVYLSHNVYRTSVYIFVLVLFFLLFFKPFGLSELTDIAVIILVSGYGIMAVLGYVLGVAIFKPSKKLRWTRFNDFLTYTVSIVFIWLMVYTFSIYYFDNLILKLPGVEKPIPPAKYFFVKCFFYTFGFGYFIYFILHLYDIICSYNKKYEHNISLKELNKEYFKTKSSSIILLKGKNENESISIHKKLFICINSEGHYLKIFYLTGTDTGYVLKNEIFRASLKEIELQVSNFQSIYRCHKQHIINLEFLNSIDGNIHRAFANVSHYPEKIPISKNKISFLMNVAKDRQQKT